MLDCVSGPVHESCVSGSVNGIVSMDLSMRLCQWTCPCKCVNGSVHEIVSVESVHGIVSVGLSMRLCQWTCP